MSPDAVIGLVGLFFILIVMGALWLHLRRIDKKEDAWVAQRHGREIP